jgi:hypothetical protein
MSAKLPCLRYFVSTVVLGLMLVGPSQAGNQPKAVVELFTSQGCSSCPPADKLAGELAEQEGVIVLSLPVDYWDYLGWKDTLASAENSARQRAYARSRGDTAVYTPQVVINGQTHAVGSDRRAISARISKVNDSYGGFPVPLDLAIDRDVITVRTGAAPDRYVGENAIMWLVTFSRRQSVAIARGENRGRTVTYHNVVRRMQPIGLWKGAGITVDLPKSELVKNGVDGCAVLLQLENDGNPGRIIGAAMIPDLKP